MEIVQDSTTIITESCISSVEDAIKRRREEKREEGRRGEEQEDEIMIAVVNVE